MNRRGINGEVWGLFFYKPKLVRKKTANRQHRQIENGGRMDEKHRQDGDNNG